MTNGTHAIYFSVKDNSDAWSQEATATVIVDKPITEDPIYQELLGLNETLNDRIDDLTQQNANLTGKLDTLTQQNTNLNTKVDTLSQQNANLTSQVDSLSQKIDLMILELLGASVVIIVLVCVTITIIYMSKRRPSSV